MTDITVSKITNIVDFKVDNNSYSKALRAIRKLSSEWSRATSKMGSAMAQGRAIGGGGTRSPRASPVDRTSEIITAGNIRRQSMYGNAGAASMAKRIGDLNDQFKAGAITLQVYRQNVAAIEREFRRARASATTLGDNLKGLRTAFIALTAGNVLFTGGRAVMQTGQMFQGIEAAMSMTSETASETADKIKYIREESYRLGLDLKTASQGFVQLSVSANKILSGSQTQELFTGMSEYATALGLDAFRYEKALLGFTQIANKGQLMAEEVKNQIGEQLPGALDLFVSAASEFAGKELTTPEFFKMMQDGELLAKDILPLMGKRMSEAAKKGGALDKMLVSNGVALRRLTMTWQNFQNEFFKGGFGTALTNTFNMLGQMLKDNAGLAKTLGTAFKKITNNLINGFTMVYDVSLAFWLLMDHYLFSKMPEGMKEFLADWGSIIAAVLSASATFRGLYGILKMIFGLGSLTKSLGLDKTTSPTGGKPAGKIAGALNKIPLVAQIAAVSYMAADAADEALSSYIPGYRDFDAKLTESMQNMFTFKAPQPRTDMRPSLQTPLQPLPDVNVNVKLNEGELKNLIDVQIQNETTKVMNQLGSSN